MNSITKFIVKQRNTILILFIIVSVISLFVSKKVNINNDIAKYLPKTSETRIGMDIMEENFDELKNSNINIMFKNISNEDKFKIKEELESIENVESVSYDETDKYNNGDYTLYIVNVSEYDDSQISKKVYEEVKEKYENYDTYYSGSIVSANEEILSIWIIILAVACAMVILIFMSNSYVEPFIILFTILLAVSINKGTNVIFPSVSNITDSICAILQMALSMDYSIMLINRFRQEKQKTKNKVKAMENALHHSLQSISSSSITTIVGLLALVFMSFTIGKDLGFVLAKGVLLSLISIFLCLPGLLLLLDNLIVKTNKKVIPINTKIFSKIAIKTNYFITPLFIVIFMVAFLLKGSLGITYTGSENDNVNKYFKENNQIVLVYNNEYEDLVTNYCNSLNDESIEDILCYGNTINEKLSYKELPEKLKNLDNEIDVDDYLLKIMYYYYFNKDINVKISYNDLINFIKSNVYKNKDLNKNIDKTMKNNIDKLTNFTSPSKINTKKSASTYSDILNIDKDTINDLFTLYHSNNINIKVKVDDFLDFINKKVLTDKKYSKEIDKKDIELINKATPFTNKKTITSNKNSKELSKLFNIDEESVNKLLLSYYLNKPATNKMTIDDFILKTTYIKNNTSYLDGEDLTSLLSLESIAKNSNNINAKQMNKSELNLYFKDINPTLVTMVYTGASLPDVYKLTPSEFITFTLTNFNTYLDEESINNLKLLQLIIDSTTSEEKDKYSVNELSSILNIDNNKVNKLYVLINYTSGYKYELTPVKLVDFIISNKELSSSLDKNKTKDLSLAKELMNSTISGKKYTVFEMSKSFDIDKEQVKLLYTLYDIKINKTTIKINSKDFINFLTSDVINNSKYNKNFSDDSIKKIKTIKEVIKSSLNKEKLNHNEIYNNLSILSDDLNKDLIDLVLMYYGSINNYKDTYKLTIEEFSNYLYNDILNDKRFDDYISKDMKKDIIDSKANVNDAKELLKNNNYSRAVINTKFSHEDSDVFDFIKNTREELNTKDNEIYVIGNSPMAYDMSNSFNSEMNLITILTMLFIFVVVAISFKSITIPTILVLIIQCAVFLTMGILSASGQSVYFIALLIVQSILMGATIDYAIVYTSYYVEYRKKYNINESIKNAFEKSIHTILTSSLILTIVTLIVGNFSSNIAAKICTTISEGTICSTILILLILPAVIKTFDRFIIKNKKH